MERSLGSFKRRFRILPSTTECDIDHSGPHSTCACRTSQLHLAIRPWRDSCYDNECLTPKSVIRVCWRTGTGLVTDEVHDQRERDRSAVWDVGTISGYLQSHKIVITPSLNPVYLMFATRWMPSKRCPPLDTLFSTASGTNNCPQ